MAVILTTVVLQVRNLVDHHQPVQEDPLGPDLSAALFLAPGHAHQVQDLNLEVVLARQPLKRQSMVEKKLILQKELGLLASKNRIQTMTKNMNQGNLVERKGKKASEIFSWMKQRSTMMSKMTKKHGMMV